MKRLAANRDAKIAKYRNRAIRRTGYPKRWPDEIADEQKGKCFYCRRPTPKFDRTLDHKLPVSRGGKTQRANLVMACRSCNYAKGTRTTEEFLQPVRDQM